MAAFTTSAEGYALIKHFEGLARQVKDPQGNFTGFVTAYKPTPDDNWTIGYGQEGALFPGTPGEIPVVEGLIISEKQAEDALRFFVFNVAEPLVNSHFNPQTQGEFDALVSWVYNIRHDRLNRGEYTLPVIFNRKPRDYDGIIEWWLKYVNPKTSVEQGLYRRRLAELCLMFGWPWKYATTAVLRRLNGVIVERTEPDYILRMAEAAAETIRHAPAPKPAPAPEKPPAAKSEAPAKPAEPKVVAGQVKKPPSPNTKAPVEVGIDPNAGLKHVSESERAQGWYIQRSSLLILRLATLGMFGTGAKGAAEFVQQDATLTAVMFDLWVPLAIAGGALVISYGRFWWGKYKETEGRKKATQGLYV